jgi:hypothetical protein
MVNEARPGFVSSRRSALSAAVPLIPFFCSLGTRLQNLSYAAMRQPKVVPAPAANDDFGERFRVPFWENALSCSDPLQVRITLGI